MSTRVRIEEFAPLADFIKVSFERDLSVIAVKKPKLNAVYLTEFSAKLDEVKVMESGLVLTEQQKATTILLYAEARLLDKKLNFLSSYMKDAGLSSGAVSDLKSDLKRHNIEGAILRIESVRQFVIANKTALEEEGMDNGFVVELDGHKTSLSARNVEQNTFMDKNKTLTDANKTTYKVLFSYITKIADAGKLVFDGTVTKDEYTVSKIVGRMRAANRASVVPPSE